jgi:hypothetical protein
VTGLERYFVWDDDQREPDECEAVGKADAAQAFAERHSLPTGARIYVRRITPRPRATVYEIKPTGWVYYLGDEDALASTRIRRGEDAGLVDVMLNDAVKIAYADPPYPGQAKKHYGDHPDYAGEVDHPRSSVD